MEVCEETHHVPLNNVPTMLEESNIETIWVEALSFLKSLMAFLTSSFENLPL